jgi:hypothetical protein
MHDLLQDRHARDLLVREAHGIPVPVLSSPALIWHLALWPTSKKFGPQGEVIAGEDPQDSKSEAEYAEKDAAWIDGINRTIGKIEHGRRNDGCQSPAQILLTTDYSGFPSVSKSSCEISISWRGIEIDVIVNIYYDFVTFSFFLDIKKNRLARQTSPERSSEHLFERVCAAVDAATSAATSRAKQIKAGNLSDLVPELMEEAERTAPAAAVRERPEAAAADLLFREFWEENFAEDIALSGEPSEPLFPGEAFAKFFGIVMPFEDGRESQTFDEIGDDDLNARLAIQSYWPFIRQANHQPDDRHFIACSMLDKRALYITAMGAQAIASEKFPSSIEIQPVAYVILVRPNADPHQTGRLVEHINSLGTMRLIALKEIGLLRRLGTIIRIFGHRLDEIATSFTRVLKDAPSPTADSKD